MGNPDPLCARDANSAFGPRRKKLLLLFRTCVLSQRVCTPYSSLTAAALPGLVLQVEMLVKPLTGLPCWLLHRGNRGFYSKGPKMVRAPCCFDKAGGLMVSAGLAIEMSMVENTSSSGFETCLRVPAALEGETLGCWGELGRET